MQSLFLLGECSWRNVCWIVLALELTPFRKHFVDGQRSTWHMYLHFGSHLLFAKLFIFCWNSFRMHRLRRIARNSRTYFQIWTGKQDLLPSKCWKSLSCRTFFGRNIHCCCGLGLSGRLRNLRKWGEDDMSKSDGIFWSPWPRHSWCYWPFAGGAEEKLTKTKMVLVLICIIYHV